MPTYELFYFPIRGAADPIRMVFHHAGVEFKDNHVGMDVWQQKKGETPFGHLPYLKVDGQVYGETTAIVRYVGEKFGLGGATPEDKLIMDSVVDAAKDLMTAMLKPSYPMNMKDEDRAPYFAEKKKEFPKTFEFIERQLGKTSGPFVAGGKISWADYHLLGMWFVCCHFMGHDVFDSVPNIKKHGAAMHECPQVKSFMEKTKDVPTYPWK